MINAAAVMAGAVLRAMGSELLRDDEAVFLVAEDQGWFEKIRVLHAKSGFLKQRIAPGEWQELLGIGPSRQRPEARARSPGQDDRVYAGG